MPAFPSINWPYFLIALVLLWFPRQWMRNGRSVLKKRRKPDGALERLAGMGARDPEDRSVQPGREFTNFRNYVDLLRAFAGGYCLLNFSFRETSDPDLLLFIFVLQALGLLIGTLVQSVRHDGRLSFFAALFYLLGMTAGTCGHSSGEALFTIGHGTGLFAFALVLAINPVIPNPRMFLAAFGFLLLPFGFVFGADRSLLVVNAALILLAPFLSLLTKRPVVIFSRKGKSTKT